MFTEGGHNIVHLSYENQNQNPKNIKKRIFRIPWSKVLPVKGDMA